MHASAIGHFKRPEIALIGEGAGADVLGTDSSQINKGDTDAVLKAFPRLGFKGAFITDVYRGRQEASCAWDEVLSVISGNAMWTVSIRRTSAI